MLTKNNLSKIFATLLIVIIGVNFVMSLDKLKGKTSSEEEVNKNKVLEAVSSNRRTRVVAAPIHMSSESKRSKKWTKSKKKKKKIEYNKDNDKENGEQEEDDGEDESGGSYPSNANDYAKRPVIKYVPIPVYLKPKTTTTPSPYETLSMADIMSYSMGMKNMMSNSPGYGFTGMSADSNAMPPTYGSGDNLMGMSDEGIHPNSYMSTGYESMGNSGYKDPKYVIANYVNRGQNDANDDNTSNGNTNNKQGQDWSNRTVNNKTTSKPKATIRTWILRSRKSTTTSTTTEEPGYVPENDLDDDLEDEESQQHGDNMSKANQIAKMLEMLDKFN